MTANIWLEGFVKWPAAAKTIYDESKDANKSNLACPQTLENINFLQRGHD